MQKPLFAIEGGQQQEIRVYGQEYEESETGSEASGLQAETGATEPLTEPGTVAARLLQNQGILDQEQTSWTLLHHEALKCSDGSDAVFIRNPTASKLGYRVMNPYLYRNIRSAGSTLKELASLIGSPPDWENRYEEIVTLHNGYLMAQFNQFRGLPEHTSEADNFWLPPQTDLFPIITFLFTASGACSYCRLGQKESNRLFDGQPVPLLRYRLRFD